MTVGKLDLPWRVSEYSECGIEDRNGVSIIRDGDMDADWVDLYPEQRDFIVKAVNNHDALVAMVRELRGLVRVTGPMTDARKRADALLASLD